MGEHSTDWTAMNQRRVELINQKYDKGLNPNEETELQQLQEEMDRHLETVAPLPFQNLEELEEQARRLVHETEIRKDPVPGSPWVVFTQAFNRSPRTVRG